MAVLKDLIVHGSSRFLNKIYASQIQAEEGHFNKLMAKDLQAGKATVIGLLDVKGQMHTNSWTNSNMATINGSFYITPTITIQQGTAGNVAVTSNQLSFSGTTYTVNSLYLDSGAVNSWPVNSKVLVTGEILNSNDEWIPLGTLLGTLSTYSDNSIIIAGLLDKKNQSSNILAELVTTGISSTKPNYRNIMISLYERYNSSNYYPIGIYMTATGQNGKTFLDIYGGGQIKAFSPNHGGLAKPNVRIGNLEGLQSVGGITPSGWGIYTTHGFFEGTIAATKGYIGDGTKYWTIANDSNNRSYIYNGTNSISSTNVGVYLGTDGIRNYKDATHLVTIKDGVITALGVDLSGKITATSGTIGGASIEGGILTVPAAQVSGELTAATISGAKITSGTIEIGKLNTAVQNTISNAANTALSYITLIDANGIWITPSGKKPSNTSTGAGATGVRINADGMEIFKDGTSVADYGDDVRIGESDSAHIELSPDGIEGIGNNNLQYFKILGNGTITGSSPSAWGQNKGKSTGTYEKDASLVFTPSFSGISNGAGISFGVKGKETGTNNYGDYFSNEFVYGIESSITGNIQVNTNSYSIQIDYNGSTSFTLTFLEDTLLNNITAEASWRSIQYDPVYVFGKENSNNPLGRYAFLSGFNITASGNYSHAEGYDAIASGDYSHAEGRKTKADSNYSHAEGYNTIAGGDYSHAEGQSSEATATAAHVEGVLTEASSYCSHAEGNATTASADASHAEGYHTTASGARSHAEGGYTTASGACSHAEGDYTTASKASAHAEGTNTIASGAYSHAEGDETTASQWASHAEGWNTISSSYGSHAEGYYTTASGTYSHAQNNHTYATASSSTTIGKYNLVTSTTINEVTTYDAGNYAFIIGNGTTDNARSNALTVDWSGNLVTSGSITDGSGNILSAKADTTTVNTALAQKVDMTTPNINLDISASSGTTDYDLYAAITALGWGSEVIV